MKIYITGSVASGKSTLARRISQIIEIPCYHLDEVVHIPAPEEASGIRNVQLKKEMHYFMIF